MGDYMDSWIHNLTSMQNKVQKGPVGTPDKFKILHSIPMFIPNSFNM